MTWSCIDDHIDDHPLVSRLSDAAHRLWINSMIYCARHLTDGHVPPEIPAGLVRGRRVKRLITELVTLVEPYGSLWEVDDLRGGYRVIHHLKWNRTRAEVEEAREAAKVRKEEWQARRAAQKASEGEEDGPERAPELPVAKDDAPRPSDGQRRRDPRPGRRQPKARASSVGETTSSKPRAATAAAPPEERVPERVRNATPSSSPSPPLPHPDPRSPTGVCDQDPRAPAQATPGEHAHTAGVGDEIDPGGDGDRAPPQPVLAETDDASPRPPAAEADAGADPDVAAILAHLRAMPEPMRHLATPEHASRFAGARMSGLTLDEIRAAISSAGLKLGRHRRAHPDRPETLDHLADHVGSFLIHQDRKTSDATPQLHHEVDPVAVERFLGMWCELYWTAKAVAYAVTDEDRVHAAELLELAHQAAIQESVRTGSEEPGLEKRISEHWIRAYVRDEGPAGYLVRARHALRYMRRQVGTYGLPQRARKLAKCQAPEPSEQAATAEETAAGAAQVLRACAAVGGGGDRFRVPVPRASGTPEAG